MRRDKRVALCSSLEAPHYKNINIILLSVEAATLIIYIHNPQDFRFLCTSTYTYMQLDYINAKGLQVYRETNVSEKVQPY